MTSKQQNLLKIEIQNKNVSSRDAAAATYHKHECGIMKLLLESGQSGLVNQVSQV
jgi:hypothetical protein